MTGFSPEWLALREPADRAARNPQVLAACRLAFGGRDELTICDMGAGTGASVRALAPLLPRRQAWVLIDHDHRNLAAAMTALDGWMTADDHNIRIRTLQHDFGRAPTPWPAETGLVTASALLDLPSTSWIDAFVSALAARRLPALITLTVDGVMTAEPVHAFDEPVFTAFRKHQRGDKGFGPSAGPAAARYLEQAFIDAGYTIDAGDSPWTLDQRMATLVRDLLAGIAGAARETGDLNTADIDGWLADRLANTSALVIGHRDVFACL